jgi:hypothetical protein
MSLCIVIGPLIELASPCQLPPRFTQKSPAIHAFFANSSSLPLYSPQKRISSHQRHTLPPSNQHPIHFTARNGEAVNKCPEVDRCLPIDEPRFSSVAWRYRYRSPFATNTPPSGSLVDRYLHSPCAAKPLSYQNIGQILSLQISLIRSSRIPTFFIVTPVCQAL